MVTGDVTTTYLGEATTSGAITTVMTSLNVGAATVATSTASILVVPIGNQTFFFKQARAA